jgi:predicted lysophospholipase L1 biosynthesis ABC-type transport system permease subunit
LLVKLLSLLLVELSLLLGLQLLPVLLLLLGLLLLLLLSFLPPRPPSYVFAVISSQRWQGACCPAHALVEDNRKSLSACCLCSFQKPVWPRHL